LCRYTVDKDNFGLVFDPPLLRLAPGATSGIIRVGASKVGAANVGYRITG
jgi:hypothetical protein